ncbi:MAG: NAD-dependent DNA ligase LigA [Candidatus Nealsonbacteria bacterium]|nr:NAD-dependent DNA ligase LigA [Candidatus Nealsonbacteria bacterium]
MEKKEAEKRIEKLKEVISYHRYLYHALGKQEISEDALDSLKHELFLLEQEFPELITPDSPTQRVAGEPLDGFQKVDHRIPMLSIEDIFSEQELEEWEEYLKRLAPEESFSYFAEPKIDGFAVSLTYQGGLLEMAATRGNGKVGEDVTQNIKTIESIPLKLRILSSKDLAGDLVSHIKEVIGKEQIEVRGEVYMEKKDFDRLNAELESKGEKTFANPRNLAAGSIRQLDPALAASRPLNFFAYDIVTDLGGVSHSKKHQIMSSLGFKTDSGRICLGTNEVTDYFKEIEEKRDSFPFQIDGVVVTVDDTDLFSRLGVVGKSPRGVRAFKFPPKKATTVIKDIKLQVGRTGALTPVAVLKPVEIDGVTISRATLHNEDEIKRLDVKIGDTVIVGRAGDVIPVVLKVLPKMREKKQKDFKMPRKCPVCGTELVKPEGESIWRCPNPGCFARQKKYFYHFVSKGAFDIEGLGPKIVDKLIEEGLASDPADLFTLEQGDLIPLEGFAEKAAENLIESIHSRKEITLPRFVYALGIRNVGEETAYLLSDVFGSMREIRNASLSQLEEIRDIGPTVAASIREFFDSKANIEFLEKLKKVGVKIKREAAPSSKDEAQLKGLSFVFTGALERMTRKEAQSRVRKKGGRVASAVSSQTSYVVAGEKPGSKLDKARQMGINIIGEEEFIKITQ